MRGVGVILTDWPLVGRRAELARVAELLGRADVRGIVLAGTSGVGKTRIGDECLRIATGAGFSTARVAATRAAATIPLGALAPLLPALGMESGPDLLARARDALTRLADGRPLLVLVDDAHLLDDASAALLHQIAIDAGIFVVATVRNGEPVPDAVVALWKDGHAERIEIEPLDERACDELITIVLGGSVDGGSLRALWRACEGNPLVLRELLLGAQEAGTLTDERGIWRLRGPALPSGRLLELIQGRLGGLDAEQRYALELVALGEPVPVEVLEAVTGLAPLEQLEDKGLLEVRHDRNRANAWLVHPLHGEVVRASMPTLRARMVRRALADATEAAGARRRGDILRIATWRIESGTARDPHLLVTAARQARYADDEPAALRLAQAAVEAGGGFDAQYLYGQVLCELGRREEGDAVLAGASAADDLVHDEQLALLAVTRSDNLFWGLARHDDAERVVADAEAAVSEPVAVAQLVAQRASFEVMLGRVDEAAAMVLPLLDSSTGRAFVEASVVAEQVLVFQGRVQRALEVAERGFAAHLELGDQPMTAHPGIHIITQCLALNAAGRVKEAEALGQMGYDVASGTRRSAGQAWFAMILGQTALTDGRVATALRRFREGASIFGELRHHAHRWCLGGAGIAAGMARDAAACAAVVAELAAAPATPVLLSEPDVLRGEAWCRLVEGDLPRARRLFEDAADLAARTGQAALEMAALHDLARTGAPEGATERLEALARRVDGPLAALRARHAAAMVAHDADALEEIAGGMEELGLALFAAEALAEAAAVWARDGERRRSDAAALRSAAVASSCETARTPQLLKAHAPVPLTRREREIAVLAAQGLASKAIADTLYLSIRTVDNHLQRVYTKLGVRGRDELGAALGL